MVRVESVLFQRLHDSRARPPPTTGTNITQPSYREMYRDVKNYSCMFEISRLSAARQLDQPMHSQSANFGKFLSSIL